MADSYLQQQQQQSFGRFPDGQQHQQFQQAPPHFQQAPQQPRFQNVCIKCGKLTLALDIYNSMRVVSCLPNVVTYNTLVDVYGKLGQWERAIHVLDLMKHEGVEPVLRTYNTLIIACNMCNQPREALAVYQRLLSDGYTPNSTTYNALISAYGKTTQLGKALEVYGEMLRANMDRSVITYSSLISACEKAGQCETALRIFNEMQQDNCVPNTVTYNSLVTACAQGGRVATEKGPQHLPTVLAIVTDMGKASREQGNCIVKEAVAAMMSFWDAPFRLVQDGVYASVLEAGGMQAADWVCTTSFTAQLASLFPIADSSKWQQAPRYDRHHLSAAGPAGVVGPVGVVDATAGLVAAAAAAAAGVGAGGSAAAAAAAVTQSEEGAAIHALTQAMQGLATGGRGIGGGMHGSGSALEQWQMLGAAAGGEEGADAAGPVM
ncbi:hypothetical protein TSOC_005641 [Tetrabaena socialis]|uniref:Pentatricopeptide repeat-containing protein n=1 Tax=Tetrabaena socialis TaxID=47790 RepID=A0A2J8A5U3_9CHLO|nr:hypothetical protein TSOC_005641 [Tetrabaena socialis]|eukprot:PNH07870.1 hypothetical protein TSOC_005641 [Tetrabaena socialis]